MLIESNEVQEKLVVTLFEKRLDAKIAVDFKQRMTDFISEGDKPIVLNLHETEFIDSSGLGAIVSSLKAAGASRQFSICGLQEPVKTMFKLTRMDKVFSIFP
ncbi:MAG: STAS domain-containing protein, partial [Pseudomonadota bacterium]